MKYVAKDLRGPWKYNKTSQSVENNEEGLVAIVRSGGFLPGQFSSNLDTNGKLIAAVPEMLEAMEKAMEILNGIAGTQTADELFEQRDKHII